MKTKYALPLATPFGFWPSSMHRGDASLPLALDTVAAWARSAADAGLIPWLLLASFEAQALSLLPVGCLGQV